MLGCLTFALRLELKLLGVVVSLATILDNIRVDLGLPGQFLDALSHVFTWTQTFNANASLLKFMFQLFVNAAAMRGIFLGYLPLL